MDQIRPCPLCQSTSTRGLQTRPFQGVDWTLACCESCGFHFTSPLPTDRQVERFYSGDFHDALRSSGGSEQAFGARFDHYVQWIEGFIKSGRSLDVGCASGLLPYKLKQLGFEAEGIEMHPETAAWGSEHYKIPIRVGSLELLAGESDCYDLMTMTEVVEHTQDPIWFMQQVHRLLKPGGFALVTFPDITAFKSRYYQWLAKITGRDWLWVTNRAPLHISEFSYPTAKMLFDKTGFSIAGFRRREEDGELDGKFSIFMWPVKPLHLFSKQLGSQMEFMIRKEG